MCKGSVYKITRQMRMQQNSKDIYSSFWQFGVFHSLRVIHNVRKMSHEMDSLTKVN